MPTSSKKQGWLAALSGLFGSKPRKPAPSPLSVAGESPVDAQETVPYREPRKRPVPRPGAGRPSQPAR